MGQGLRRFAAAALLLGLLLLQAHLALHAYGLDHDDDAPVKGRAPQPCLLCAALFTHQVPAPPSPPALALAELSYQAPAPEIFRSFTPVFSYQPLLRGPPAFLPA
jgi:hypothetical protein